MYHSSKTFNNIQVFLNVICDVSMFKTCSSIQKYDSVCKSREIDFIVSVRDLIIFIHLKNKFQFFSIRYLL